MTSAPAHEHWGCDGEVGGGVDGFGVGGGGDYDDVVMEEEKEEEEEEV